MATEIEVIQELIDLVSKIQDTVLEHSSILKELIQKFNEIDMKNR